MNELLSHVLHGRHDPIRQPDAGGYYQDLFEEVSAYFVSVAPVPELEVVYTRDRDSMLFVDPRDASHYLVYDQYLGQSINHINTVLRSDCVEEALWVYSHKVIAERFRSSGRFVEALHFALLYGELKLFIRRHLLSAMANMNRAFDTRLAEMFIVAHELAHVSFEEPDNALMQVFYDANLLYIQQYGIFSGDPSVENEIPKYVESWTQIPDRLHHYAIELACDEIATAIIVAAVDSYTESAAATATSLHATQLSLRWLSALSGIITTHLRNGSLESAMYDEFVFGTIRASKNNVNLHRVMSGLSDSLNRHTTTTASYDGEELQRIHGSYIDLFHDRCFPTLQIARKELEDLLPEGAGEDALSKTLDRLGIEPALVEQHGITRVIDAETGWLLSLEETPDSQ